LKLVAGAARDMVVASARTTGPPIFSRAIMVSQEGSGGGPREAIPGGVMGGRCACVLNKRSQGAVEGGGQRARGTTLPPLCCTV
jgi:hypothetical protein